VGRRGRGGAQQSEARAAGANSKFSKQLAWTASINIGTPVRNTLRFWSSLENPVVNSSVLVLQS
jgi:hypothetical protein